MAIAVERKYTKDEILDMYLNSVFFGEGAFGVKDAAKTYFGTTPDKLTVAQSSMLIGLLPAPSVYSPISGDAQLAKQRQHYVLDQMARHHYITKEQKTAALGTKLTYAHAAESTFIHAQHYAMMVIDKLNDKYGDERVVRSGFTVTTGLDLSMQTQAETIIKKRVAQFADQGGSNAGLVAIDPRSGEVRVLVGSVDWNNKQFGKYNMALALRQPGSSFKPIYYAEAFQKHLITPATIMHDRPTTFGDWTPVNYDGRYRGNIKVRDALATSLNIPAAEVMERVGVETAAQAAKRMGITTIHNPESYGLTLALGTAEVQLYQLTNAYAAFANGGVQHDPTLITSIKDKYGKTVYKAPHESERVQSEQASFLINSILSDNVARAPSYGSSLNVPGHQVAVKTGTTNDNRDAWTLGYTPSLTVGVWVGNNQNVPMQGLYGGNSAGRIWDEVMRSYLRNTPDEPFDVPKGIVQLYMCPGTELRTANDARSSYREYFIVGTQPQGECRVKHETKTPKKHEDNKKPDKPTKPGTTDTAPTPPPPDDGTGGGTGDGGTTTPPPPPDDGTPPPPDDGTNPPPTGT
jgi:membrane peptidoglycan carboxypeptidase